jgi:hypothetical protein
MWSDISMVFAGAGGCGVQIPLAARKVDQIQQESSVYASQRGWGAQNPSCCKQSWPFSTRISSVHALAEDPGAQNHHNQYSLVSARFAQPATDCWPNSFKFQVPSQFKLLDRIMFLNKAFLTQVSNTPQVCFFKLCLSLDWAWNSMAKI